ncbi:response regulator transcription factor [Paenibacillus sp. EC2-1]|uniref:response regulator transcription factor n=1 Tax=Paenibacillus sp. EC2-1 TaxID=3388665 RepID=UPI003BEEC240
MTLKVMLADDELLVRLGIKSLIEWEKHGFSFIGDAPDGEKALELMEQEAPDILLTDIIMPRMDGLELIETAKRYYPDTLFIVLSSHNEFDYVRKAMKMGVEDYILKASLKPAELLQILMEASRKIAKRKEHHPLDLVSKGQEGSKRDAITAALSRRIRKEQQAISEGSDVADLGDEVLSNSILMILQPQLMREGVQESSAMKMLVHLFQSELGESLLCNPVETAQREIVLLLLEHQGEPSDHGSFAEQLMGASSRMLGIALSVGISGPIHNWSEVDKAYKQAHDMLNDSRIKETAREDINRLLEYMKEHFDTDISLKKAADYINMSESYLSYVFKKETGTGFTDYLNMLRVDKAAHILINSQMPIYEIALQVGYENINYFGRIFKKIKGVSPQRYRSQFK